MKKCMLITRKQPICLYQSQHLTKKCFDHLTEGYDKLGNFTERKVLPDRAGALLDGPDANKHIPPELTEDLKPNPDYSKANPTAVQKDY